MAGYGRSATVHFLWRQFARGELGGGGAHRQRGTALFTRLLVTGGGTGGHIYPALAIVEALRSGVPSLDVLFAGSRSGLEATIVPKAGLALAFVASAPLERRISLSLARTVAANAQGIAQAIALAKRFKPHVVVATGGYVAFPVVAGARLASFGAPRKLPIGLLEPNAEPGLTNRLLVPFVDEIWLDAGETRGKTVVTGTPVRASLRLPLDRDLARRQLGLDPGRATIVVIGGSQGARRLNEAITGLDEPARRNGWQVLALTGEAQRESVQEAARDFDWLHVSGYLDDPAPAYAAADIVVARAGASTLAELAATGTPALLVPYPHATAGHQMRNAQTVAASGAARVIADEELDAARLARELESALEPGAIATLRQAARTRTHDDPSARIAARIVRLAERG